MYAMLLSTFKCTRLSMSDSTENREKKNEERRSEDGGSGEKIQLFRIVQFVYTNVIMQCLHLLETILMHCE